MNDLVKKKKKKKKRARDGAQACTALWRLRQEDQEFDTSLGYFFFKTLS
jgi:hypothetical protein